MAVKTYAPDQVVVTLGPVLVSGYATDSMISIEFNEDAFTLQMGVDGKGTRSRNANRSGRVTITLQQSSSSNDLLSGIAALDAASGAGVLPLLIKDMSGRSIYAAESAWIVKEPAAAFAKESGPREWILETDRLNAFTGGN